MNHKYLSPLFALLICVAHLNCVVEHRLFDVLVGNSFATVQDDAISPSQGTWPSESDDCESGCICHGATLADHFVVADVEDNWSRCCLALFSPADFQYCHSEFTDNESTRCSICCLSLRALDRCALLQSFLI